MVKVASATLLHTHSELASAIVEQLICKLTLNTVSSDLGTKTGSLARVVHYDTLKEGLSDRENVSLMLVKNKGHNPNYTEDAVKLLLEFGKARAAIAKNKKATKEDKARFVASFDWERMTCQDENIWKEIFNHLNK